MPIMLNPVLFIPFLLSTVITATIGYLGSVMNFISYYNPVMAIGLPWTTPKMISSIFTMGWQGFVLRIVCFVIMIFVYMPFIKVLDNKEIEIEKEKEAVTNVE